MTTDAITPAVETEDPWAAVISYTVHYRSLSGGIAAESRKVLATTYQTGPEWICFYLGNRNVFQIAATSVFVIEETAQAPGWAEAELFTALAAIEANDTNYPTRYGLVLDALAAAHRLGYNAGIGIDHTDEAAGFRTVVYIQLPTGQISWHMPEYGDDWDEHDTETKYERVKAWLGEHAPF